MKSHTKGELRMMDGRECEVCGLVLHPLYEGNDLHNPVCKGTNPDSSMHFYCFCELMKILKRTEITKEDVEKHQDEIYEELYIRQMKHRNAIDELETHLKLLENKK